MPTTIGFPTGASALPQNELHAVEAWAACLRTPALEHTTIVLVGVDDPTGSRMTFEQRALAVRDVLVRRGVQPERIVIPIGPPSLARQGVGDAPSDGVRLDITHSLSPRLLAVPVPIS